LLAYCGRVNEEIPRLTKAIHRHRMRLTPGGREAGMMGWVLLHRSDETLVLMKEYPQAFLLLCQIALLAKRKDCRITKLKARQARIGDWREAGITSEKPTAPRS